MDAIVSYLATFAGEFAAALLPKVSDPIAWVACLGGLLLGGAAAWWRPRSWAWALTIAAFVFVIRLLADAYSAPVSRGDNAALAFIAAGGFLAGMLLARSLRRRSV
jgi:hypothetical protein